MRRHILSAAAPACLLIGLTPLAASAGPAPLGTATATAVQAGSLLGLSSSGASADPGQADASASVISLGGQPLLGTGGSQASTGEGGGALLDTGGAAPVHVEVAPWHTAASGSASDAHRASSASAAAARAEAPGVARAGLLTSQAQADHRTEQSTATSASDAADLSLADFARLVLLHSEVGSDGQGHSALIGLNGTEIGTSDQLGQGCRLDAAGVASLACLTASGGIVNGLTGGAAEVLGVQTALGLDPVSAFGASASSGTGSPSVLPGVTTTPLPSTDTARALTPAAGSTGLAALPRTGVAVASLVASALAALLSGLALRLLGRRRLAA